MKVLDLCSGIGGASRAFVDRGHEVVTLDIDSKFNPTICMDIREYHGVKGSFDVVLAAPPCTVFSLASSRWHWKYIDTSFDKKIEALQIVKACFRIFKEIEPHFYVLENPRGFLRRFIGLPTETIYYSSYGYNFKKSTDLWHNLPKTLKRPYIPPPINYNGKSKIRDFRVGPRDPAIRAEWPYQLSLEICKICEENLYPLQVTTQGDQSQCQCQ
jgi:hypothetical protein